jgi:AraC-like DNA-binding protein
LAPGELILINPEDPVDLTYSADCEKFIVKVPKLLLESICHEHRWLYPREGMRFANSRYRLDELEGFAGLLGLVCQEAEGAQSIPRVQQHYEHIVVTKMLSLLSTNLNRLGSGGESVTFERIAQFIELNLKQELGCEALARQANLSLRSLYLLFERNAQTTPKEYIRQRRLERIHGCLSDPQCGVGNVTEVAMDYGFAHLGRFADSYRKQFGELPSQTLKRRV